MTGSDITLYLKNWIAAMQPLIKLVLDLDHCPHANALWLEVERSDWLFFLAWLISNAARLKPGLLQARAYLLAHGFFAMLMLALKSTYLGFDQQPCEEALAQLLPCNSCNKIILKSIRRVHTEVLEKHPNRGKEPAYSCAQSQRSFTAPVDAAQSYGDNVFRQQHQASWHMVDLPNRALTQGR